MTRGLHWFRNDLRLHDNLGLCALADRVDAWLPVFVIDPDILGRSRVGAPRVRFMLDCLDRLAADHEARGLPIQVLEGDPRVLIPELMSKVGASVVSWNIAGTPLGRRRDEGVERAVAAAGFESIQLHDETVFGSDEILTKRGTPYSIYTPYRKAWWQAWEQCPRPSPTRARFPRNAIPIKKKGSSRGRARIEFESDDAVALPPGGEQPAKRRLREFLDGPARRYHLDRDRPDLDGTSRLSPYLRFGTISIRRCVTEGLRRIEADPTARSGIMKWLDELVWREFYHAVLVNSPHVLSGCFKSEYDQLDWPGREADFEAWCAGLTGYPLVDAGMRQLRASGWMHNRVRMIVASFLTKDLRIDWRRGEEFFFESLVDGDPASNNGGWQWSASTGTDAQPYFRIFNPILQGKKWDPEGRYVKRWIPELRAVDRRWIHAPSTAPDPPTDYPSPIVDHAEQRRRTLDEFKRVRAISAVTA